MQKGFTESKITIKEQYFNNYYWIQLHQLYVVRKVRLRTLPTGICLAKEYSSKIIIPLSTRVVDIKMSN